MLNDNDALNNLFKQLVDGSAVVMPKDINVDYLDTLFTKDGLLEVQPAIVYSSIDAMHLRIWCHNRGYYNLPTTELIKWVNERIAGRAAIEIGAGNGALGRALNIPITDSWMQNRPDIQEYYKKTGQPVIKYPDDVQKFDALDAIKHFKPKVVVASWVTQIYRESEHDLGGNMYGVDEEEVLKLVDTYIHIGNINSHGTKRILKQPHQELFFPWLYGRGDKALNRIYVWEKNK